MRALPSVRSALALACVIVLEAAGAAAQEKPRYGGVLTWFDYGDPGRLDVHAESPLVVQQASAGVYSGLIQYDPDDPSKIVPDLAERWTVSPDGRTYTFHLRKGVKWHDGQPFSAADVKASFDRILNPDFKSPKCGAALKPMVASVEAIGPSTVQFRLKFAAAPFLGNVASSWCRVAAKHILEKYGDLNTPEAQIGTGPFRFKRYERGNLIEWEKNKDYFVRGLPYLDGVRQYILVGGPTQLAAAKAGRIMLWDAWPPMKRTQAEELQRARTDVDIYQASINTIFLLYMNAQKPPFGNPDLRRAVSLALDRQELVAKALEGAGVPCALLDPKLVGDFAPPLEEVQKPPGCRQPKDADLAEAKKQREVADELRIEERARHPCTLERLGDELLPIEREAHRTAEVRVAEGRLLRVHIEEEDRVDRGLVDVDVGAGALKLLRLRPLHRRPGVPQHDAPGLGRGELGRSADEDVLPYAVEVR